MTADYSRERLASVVHASTSWAAVMRELGMAESSGGRRTLQRAVREHGIDTSHFRNRSPWQKYTDRAIAEAVAGSTTLREVVTKLGAPPRRARSPTSGVASRQPGST